MAPTAPTLKKPSARTLRHQRITNQIHPLAPQKLFRPDAQTTDAFLSSKKDKRIIKHSSFLSRVTARTSTTTINTGRVTKSTRTDSRRRRSRRRPLADSSKLGGLDGLADALPDVPDEGSNAGKVKHRSLNSRRGALKRKELVVRGEMDRFGASMAKLASADRVEPQPTTKLSVDVAATEERRVPQTSNRWAALRGYISATMEQNHAFINKS